MIYTFPQITFDLRIMGEELWFEIIEINENLRGCNYCIFESTNGWTITSINRPYISTEQRFICLRGAWTKEDHTLRKYRFNNISDVIKTFNEIEFAITEWQASIKIRRTEDILKEWI